MTRVPSPAKLERGNAATRSRSRVERACRIAASCCLASLAGCAFPLFPSEVANADRATEPPPRHERRETRVTMLNEPFDVVELARTDGALRFHVTTKKLCQVDVLRVKRESRDVESTRRSPCNTPLLPAANVDIGLQAGPRLVVLGTTTQSGDFTLPLSQIDALFAGQSMELAAMGQVLIHGVKAAELPLGEILQRKQQIASTLAASDRALAATDAPPQELETRLAELMDLKQQGASDPRLVENALQLYARLHPIRISDGATIDVHEANMDARTFDEVVRSLSSMCRITVWGGEVVAGALVPEGFAVKVMLGAINKAVGDDLTAWLTQRCCEMAASSILEAESTGCDTDATAS